MPFKDQPVTRIHLPERIYISSSSAVGHVLHNTKECHHAIRLPLYPNKHFLFKGTSGASKLKITDELFTL